MFVLGGHNTHGKTTKSFQYRHYANLYLAIVALEIRVLAYCVGPINLAWKETTLHSKGLAM